MQLFFNFSGAPDVVQHVDHRLRGGFNNIRRQAHTVETTAIVGDHDINLTQGILTVALGRQVIFHQLYVVLGDAVNCAVNGINRAIAVCRFGLNVFATGQFDRGSRNVAGA